VKAIRTTDAVMINSLGLGTLDNLARQVVGGDVIALCQNVERF